MKTIWMLLALSTAAAGDLRSEVLDQLGAYEGTASAEQLGALGDVGPVLLEIAQDDSVASSRRGRAITALADFPSDDAQTWLASTLKDSDGTSYLRRKSAYALAGGWGQAAVGPLKTALSADDTQLRIAAAEALGSVGGSAATQALDARLSAEDNASVREALQKALESAR